MSETISGTMQSPTCIVCSSPRVEFQSINGNFFCGGCAGRLKMPEARRIANPLPPGIVGVGLRPISDEAPTAEQTAEKAKAAALEADAREFAKTYVPPDPSFLAFVEGVDALIQSKARGKGYQRSGEANPGGALFKLVSDHCHGHPVGEIIYKAIRYASKQDPTDLLKIAAWAYLVWANRTYERVVPVLKAPNDFHSARIAPGYDSDFRGSGPSQFSPGDNPYLPEDLRSKIGVDAPSVESRIYAAGATAVKTALANFADRREVQFRMPLRLAALVCEEAGEALKEALDATREDTIGPESDPIKRQIDETIQTAAMAIISVAVLQGRVL